jgi:hypothetical protein
MLSFLTLIFKGESIKALECGFVNSTEHCEVCIYTSNIVHSRFFPVQILVVGYSGKVISFTTEPVTIRAQVSFLKINVLNYN